MRTIKFRGKKADTGKWIYGDLLTSDGTECEISDWGKVDYSRYDVNLVTIGQFTGLVDKDGKEIYEGDIISVNGKYPKLIRYIDEYACFCMANLDDLNREWMQPWQQVSPGWWNEFGREILIIGNEHDNPRLLKGGYNEQ